MVLQGRVDGCVALRLRRDSLLLLLWRRRRRRLLLNLLGNRRCRLSQAPTKVVQVVKQHVDLVLQRSHVRRHILVLLRIFKAIATIGRIDALETQVAAALAWVLAVALDFATLAFVTGWRRQYMDALVRRCRRKEDDPLPCKRNVSGATRLAAGALRAVVGFSLVAVDIARAIVVLLVLVLVRERVLLLLVLLLLMLLLLMLLLLLLLLLSNLTVRDRRNGSESMRRVHGCKAACAVQVVSRRGALVPQRAE